MRCAPHRKDPVQALASRFGVVPALVVSAANWSVISTLRAGCHFYLAPTRAIYRSALGIQDRAIYRSALGIQYIENLKRKPWTWDGPAISLGTSC
jgi:hypothetical protein